MKTLIALLLGATLGATTKTVCASGCDYSNLQTAMTATASDCAIDVLQLTAGETFSGSFAVPYRNCSGSVWVRTSAYASLPAFGTRVVVADASLMPTISANSSNNPGLKIYEQGENDMSAVDLGTDTMTIATAIPNNTAFSCTLTPPPPMVGGTIYYSIYVDATHMKASLTPGGSAIDLTGAGSVGTGYYTDPHCAAIKPRSNWRFTGIRVTVPSGTAMNNGLVVIGSWESNSMSAPANIWLDRMIITGHGDMAADGPSGGVIITGGRGITVSDSYIPDIRCWSCEGKPISIQGAVGPVTIRNNFIGGGSIGLLIGGSDAKIPGQVSNNVTVTRNYFSQPGKNMYREGAGAPTGSCYYGGGSGMFYRNTSSSGTCSTSGRCYSCESGGTWAIDTTSAYRTDDYLLKNPIELKEGQNVVVDGNFWEGQQASVDSQGNCMLMVAFAGRYLQNVTYRNNWCSNTWGGISLTSYDATIASSRISIENNLVTNMGSPALLDVNGGTNDTVWQMRVPKWTGVSMSHNTHRAHASQVMSTAFGLYLETTTPDVPAHTLPAYVQNNIWSYGTAGTRTDNAVTTCNSTSSGWGVMFLNDGSKQVRNNVQYQGTGLGGLDACATTQNLSAVASIATVDFASDSSLNTTSPYSASCASGCAFAATDGGDVGVDRVRLDSALNGVTTGVPGMAIRMALGSTRAIAHYTAPDASACTVKLYTSQTARIAANLSADTDTGGEQLDSRTGSVSSGTSRQLVLGYNSALTASTPYALVVTCGSTVALATFRTLAAGSGTYSATVFLPSANTGEYSSSADMSSPTAISSSTTQVVPVPSGAVRYYRPTGGAISALVAR